MIKKEKKKTYISPESPTTNTRTCPQRGLPFSSLCSQSRSFQNMFSSRPYKPYTPPKTNLIFKYRQTDLISKKNNSSAETPPSLIWNPYYMRTKYRSKLKPENLCPIISQQNRSFFKRREFESSREMKMKRGIAIWGNGHASEIGVWERAEREEQW